MNYIDTIHDLVVDYVRGKEKDDPKMAKKVMIAWLELRRRLEAWEHFSQTGKWKCVEL